MTNFRVLALMQVTRS